MDSKLKIRAKAVKLLEKNIGVHLHDLRFGNKVLDMRMRKKNR